MRTDCTRVPRSCPVSLFVECDREMEAKVRNLRMELRDKNKEYDKTEDDLKALQSVGQIIGELLRQLDDERYIVKASSGPRYVVGCRNKVRQARQSAAKFLPSACAIAVLLKAEVGRGLHPYVADTVSCCCPFR